VRELHFQREYPSQEGSAHQMDLTSLATDKVSKTTMLIAVLPRFDHDAASTQQAVILHRCCHLVAYTTVHVAFRLPLLQCISTNWEVQFANNPTCRNAVPLRLKALQPLTTKQMAGTYSQYKKLSYRRRTARCVVSVEILPFVTQQCRNYLHDKS